MSRRCPRHLGCNLLRRSMRHIAKADHSNHSLVRVDHGEPPDPLAFHDTHGLIHFFIVAAVGHALCHHVSCRELRWILAVGDASYHNIAVGNHADEAIVFANRDGAYVELLHLPSKRHDARVRRNPFDALVHNVLDFHGTPLCLSSPRRPNDGVISHRLMALTRYLYSSPCSSKSLIRINLTFRNTIE